MKRSETIRVEGETFDLGGEMERHRKARAHALSIADEKKRAKRVARVDGKLTAAYVGAVGEAHKRNAQPPTIELSMKAPWRIALVQAPKGSEAPAAYVIKLERGSALSPVARLSSCTPPALLPHHVRAAERLASLYRQCLRTPRLTANYDGVLVSGAGEPQGFIDTGCDAFRRMQSAMATLLPEEQGIVVEAAVFETPIPVLSRAGVTAASKGERAQAQVVQTLRLALERLARFWGLD